MITEVPRCYHPAGDVRFHPAALVLALLVHDAPLRGAVLGVSRAA